MAGTVRCCQGHVFVIRTIALSLTVIQISLMVHNIILIEASTTEFHKVAGKLSSHFAHHISIIASKPIYYMYFNAVGQDLPSRDAQLALCATGYPFGCITNVMLAVATFHRNK